MAPEQLPELERLVDAGEFSLDANPMVAREDGLIVPDTRLTQEEVPACFCGRPSVETFRGWPLCRLCRGPVKRRWRRLNRKPARMASSIKTRGR